MKKDFEDPLDQYPRYSSVSNLSFLYMAVITFHIAAMQLAKLLLFYKSVSPIRLKYNSSGFCEALFYVNILTK